MSLLATAFREAVKKTKDYSQINEMNYSVSYSTGFPSIDFANGYIQEVNGVKRFEVGISDGSINMIISDSGLGKTTICTQIACNIVKQFKTSCVFYEQAEVGTNIQRIKNLSGFSTDEEFINKFIVRDAGITIESIYDRVKMIHDIKVQNQEAYLYPVGFKDMNGQDIFKFEPTVIIVDSLKMVMSKKNTDADATSNMFGAQNAKTNSEYYTKMIPLCREANIIMFLINHITTDINTGPFMKKPEFPFLKPGEHLPGGKAITYMTNSLFRLDSKSKLNSSEGLGIDGMVISFDVVKSRTNKTGKSKCLLVFDYDKGYDPDLSLFIMLKEEKLLEGGGAYLKIPNSEKKFAQKNFKGLLQSDPEFYNTFVSFCMTYLSNKLLEDYNNIRNDESKQSNYSSPYQAMLTQLNSGASI